MRRVAAGIFVLGFGIAAGVVVGAIVMRRVDKAAKAISPENLARKAGRGAVTARFRLSDAWQETKRAAAEREAELRAEHGLPPARGTL